MNDDTDDVGALWFAAMQAGDFEAAWRQTDRIELPRRAAQAQREFVRQPHHLMWDGTPFDGRRVIVRCNHGLGDTLQFIRFVPWIVRRARRVTTLVQPHLLRLLSAHAPFGNVVNGWTDEPPPAHDVEIEIMELAYAFRCTTATLPPPPYLPIANATAAKATLPQLDRRAALRAGVLWAASDWDTTRSMPLAALAPLADVRDVAFYSLQQGRQREEWREAPFVLAPLSRHTADIEVAAAAILEFDLVITVDAMLAHLAGGLGRPVWLLLQQECDWRWMRDRPDSPWYPDMRIFRQPRQGDWPAVGRAVADALVRSAADRLSRLRDRPSS